MNVTYIIGNGFDLNLGLKTAYISFYRYYEEIKTTDKDIIKLKDDIEEKDKCWSDLEKGLGEYTECVNTPDKMISIYEDLANNLRDYIAKQAEYIPNTNETIISSLLNDIGAPEQHFKRIDRGNIERFYYLFNSSPIVNIITLNYTPTLEKLLGYDENKPIAFPHNFFNNQSVTFRRICHIHHTLEDNILLGVNDETQIKNEAFRTDQRLKEYMIKPETNKMLKDGIDEDCTNLINNTNVFVFFGASMGETDKKWWELIAKHTVSVSNSIILLCEFNSELKGGRDLGENERTVKSKFISQTNIPKEQEENLKNKIYVSINGNMFKDVKQHILLQPSESNSFTFNYSLNNGEYIIGKGKYKFTTKWSKASDKSIQAHNDAPDIKAIGLVEKEDDLKQISLKDIDVDFSLRTQQPQIGDIVIWKNVYGDIAATKILEIKDNTRGSNVDELKCEYVIYK